jgi:hypothetical protein
MENETAKQVVDSALSVHRALGPGLLKNGITRIANGLPDN